MKHHCCSKDISEKRAKEILADHSINKTKIKIQMLILLSKSKLPVSAVEIHQNIGIENCNISSIFRTLTQFKEKNLINELNLGEDFNRFELCDLENQKHHHHHVRCRECGDIKTLDKCDLSVFEKSIAKLGFKHMEHKLEFTGICSSCSSN